MVASKTSPIASLPLHDLWRSKNEFLMFPLALAANPGWPDTLLFIFILFHLCYFHAYAPTFISSWCKPTSNNSNILYVLAKACRCYIIQKIGYKHTVIILEITDSDRKVTSQTRTCSDSSKKVFVSQGKKTFFVANNPKPKINFFAVAALDTPFYHLCVSRQIPKAGEIPVKSVEKSGGKRHSQSRSQSTLWSFPQPILEGLHVFASLRVWQSLCDLGSTSRVESAPCFGVSNHCPVRVWEAQSILGFLCVLRSRCAL